MKRRKADGWARQSGKRKDRLGKRASVLVLGEGEEKSRQAKSPDDK